MILYMLTWYTLLVALMVAVPLTIVTKRGCIQ